MKQQLKPLAISLCLLGLIAIPAFAETDQNDARTQKLEKLQKQLTALQSEVAALQGQDKTRRRTPKVITKQSVDKKQKQSGLTSAEVRTTAEMAKMEEKAEASEKTNQQFLAQTPISGPGVLPDTGLQYFPFDVEVPGQSFVSTGPYIGVPLQFSGSNLIVNNPSVNQDVALLSLRKNINERLTALGLKPSDQRSHLLLSGMVEGRGVYRDIGGNHNSTDFELSGVGIDAYILGANTWTSALISLSYDNQDGATTGSFDNFARTLNSRIFVNKAFIIIGDFSQSPFYGTIGQMYVPFGTYSTTMISSPLTKRMARTQTRALLFGYQKQAPSAFYASTYVFRGDSYVDSRSINNGGVNLGYKFDRGFYTGNFGGGYIFNIADALGMQDNGFSVVPPTIPPTPPIFTGFGGVSGSGNEKLVHRVPAYNVRGLFSFGKTVDLIAEYVCATTSFNPADMTMDNHGAKPRALNLELAYTFQGISKPTSISAGYGMAKDALALGLPAQRYSAVLNTSLWRNTLQSLEFRHDVNYAASAFATGSGVPAPSSNGKADNIFTAQFDIYF